MSKIEEKYIDLLLQKGVSARDLDSLLIYINFKEHMPFAEMVKQKAYALGVKEVEIMLSDTIGLHDMLKETSVDEISLDNPEVRPYIDKSKWDEYARKHGGILFLTSTVPGILDDIPQEKIQKWSMESFKTNKYYRENTSTGVFTWTIAALPNQVWAEKVFPNDNNAYEKLYNAILTACMVDTDDPVKAWEEFFVRCDLITKRLNELDIKSLHYQNSLGTDLNIVLPEDHIWVNSNENNTKGSPVMCNIPSYEIFSSPDCTQTNGIVYSTRPLVLYGQTVEDFYLVFKNGIVVEFGAKKGKEALESFLHQKDIDPENVTDRLGEVAFVEYDSPISNTGIVYYETLFDENASCHLALGESFMETIKVGKEMNREELLACGLNQAIDHEDFMIGSKDLSIIARTSNGEVPIFEEGNFCKKLLRKN